jgi:hypothetical protein
MLLGEHKQQYKYSVHINKTYCPPIELLENKLLQLTLNKKEKKWKKKQGWM